MILNITALVLVLGITFLHSIFGLFSGLINVFCAIVAAAVALGCFEAVNDFATTTMGIHPSYSGPGSLIVLFLLTHLILRYAADTFLRGNVRVALPADIAGGIICGFVIGEITIGIFVLGFLMLPFGGRAMMFSRYERTDEIDSRTGRVKFVRNDVWLNPDGFVVGLVNTLSSGSLKRGDSTFASAYPDFREWVFWTGNTVQQESMTAPARGKDGDGHKGLKVVNWWEVTEPVVARYRKDLPTRRNPDPPYSPQNYEKEDDRNRIIAVRLAMERSAGDRYKRQVHHRFRPSMIRLVGTIPDVGGTGGVPTHYIPQILGGVDPKIGGSLRIVDIDNNFALTADGTTQIDAYFEVDERFEPSFVEYRRHARAALGVMAESADQEQLTLTQENPRTRGGRTMSFLGDVELRRSGDNAELPFPISAANLTRMGDVQGGEFVSGRVIGLQEDLSGGDSRQIRNLRIPDGLRIFQVRCRARRAQSLFGQVFNFVRGTLNQYTAVDKQGNEYMLAGYYAVVKRGGKNFLELYFTGDPDSPEATSFRQMLDFKDVKIRELTSSDDAVLGLIFLVRPDKIIHEIRTQDGKKLEVNYTMKRG